MARVRFPLSPFASFGRANTQQEIFIKHKAAHAASFSVHLFLGLGSLQEAQVCSECAVLITLKKLLKNDTVIIKHCYSESCTKHQCEQSQTHCFTYGVYRKLLKRMKNTHQNTSYFWKQEADVLLCLAQLCYSTRVPLLCCQQ